MNDHRFEIRKWTDYLHKPCVVAIVYNMEYAEILLDALEAKVGEVIGLNQSFEVYDTMEGRVVDFSPVIGKR